MESQEAGFPLLAYLKVQEHERPNPRPLDLTGVVMEANGPKCNERSSTLRRLLATCHRSLVTALMVTDFGRHSNGYAVHVLKAIEKRLDPICSVLLRRDYKGDVDFVSLRFTGKGMNADPLAIGRLNDSENSLRSLVATTSNFQVISAPFTIICSRK